MATVDRTQQFGLVVFSGAVILLLSYYSFHLRIRSSHVYAHSGQIYRYGGDVIQRGEYKLLTKSFLKESELVWKSTRKKQRAAFENLLESFEQNPWGIYDQTIIWDLFAPAFSCPQPLERIGRVGDGGKWVCAFNHVTKEKDTCVVYSYGIGNDVSFEREILEKTSCIVRMFDHTINITHGPAAELVTAFPTQAALHPVGLGVRDTDMFHTLFSTMKTQNDKFIDILKIDVEGAEFAALIKLTKSFPTLVPVAQMLVEVHLESISTNIHAIAGKLFRWYNRLERSGFRAFYSEPNQIPSIHFRKGYIDVMEYSFLNSKISWDLRSVK